MPRRWASAALTASRVVMRADQRGDVAHGVRERWRASRMPAIVKRRPTRSQACSWRGGASTAPAVAGRKASDRKRAGGRPSTCRHPAAREIRRLHGWRLRVDAEAHIGRMPVVRGAHAAQMGVGGVDRRASCPGADQRGDVAHPSAGARRDAHAIVTPAHAFPGMFVARRRIDGCARGAGRLRTGSGRAGPDKARASRHGRIAAGVSLRVSRGRRPLRSGRAAARWIARAPPPSSSTACSRVVGQRGMPARAMLALQRIQQWRGVTSSGVRP